jgi:hypothetical protein
LGQCKNFIGDGNVVRSHGVSLDHLVGAADQGRNVAPPGLVSFELEIKVAQLEHAHVHPRDQRVAM